MRAKVTTQGVTIPKRLLGEADEVEIEERAGMVTVTPVRGEDPLARLGRRPVTSGVADGSERHDHYL